MATLVQRSPGTGRVLTVQRDPKTTPPPPPPLPQTTPPTVTADPLADKRIAWIRDLVHAVRDGSGTVQGVRGLMVDITERKRAEQALRKSERKYSEAFRAKLVEGMESRPGRASRGVPTLGDGRGGSVTKVEFDPFLFDF